jgi:hypothetical protein
MIRFCKSNGNAVLRKEFPLQANTQQAPHHAFREDLSDYVAHLQLHMTLNGNGDSRESMLHQTQATLEKQISRQTYLAES